MTYDDGQPYSLELHEIIRANQLVRGRVDAAGFEAWYAALPTAEQDVLVGTLLGYAAQAGVDDEVKRQALDASGCAENLAPVVLRARPGLMDLFDFFEGAEKPVRDDLFRVTFHLFGIAEGYRFALDVEHGCDHWWHRDLLDGRVVAELLADPEYYRTSMKDDAKP